MYHGILRMYHGTLRMYHDIISYEQVQTDCPLDKYDRILTIFALYLKCIYFAFQAAFRKYSLYRRCLMSYEKCCRENHDK